MNNSPVRLGAPEWLVVIGGCLFILVLAVSAVWEADIRWLHFFQAWMYFATIWLSVRGSKWGAFIGIAAAGTWDYVGLFVNSFVSSGLHWLSQWIHTGHLAHPDQLIAVLAWLSNFMVVAGCLWAYARGPDKRPSDAGRLLVAFALTMGFFAADMALFQPRYLGLFVRMLHPHWPASTQP